MTRLLSDNRGFTYIEAVVYLGIVSLLIGSVGAMAALTYRSSGREAVRREVEEQGRQALEIMTRTVRNSSAINSPSTGVTGATLSVAVDSAPASPTVFSLSGGKIQVVEGSSAAVPLTNANVTATSLSFQNLSRTGTPGTVRVSFVLSGATGSSAPFTYTQTYYGSASLQ